MSTEACSLGLTAYTLAAVKQGICWPVSCEGLRCIQYSSSKSHVFISWPLPRYWFSFRSQAQARNLIVIKRLAKFRYLVKTWRFLSCYLSAWPFMVYHSERNLLSNVTNLITDDKFVNFQEWVDHWLFDLSFLVTLCVLQNVWQVLCYVLCYFWSWVSKIIKSHLMECESMLFIMNHIHLWGLSIFFQQLKL